MLMGFLCYFLFFLWIYKSLREFDGILRDFIGFFTGILWDFYGNYFMLSY